VTDTITKTISPVHVYDLSVVNVAFSHQFNRLIRAYAQRQHVHLTVTKQPTVTYFYGA